MGSESGGPRASTSSLANSRSQRRRREGLSAPLRLESTPSTGRQHAIDVKGCPHLTERVACAWELH